MTGLQTLMAGHCKSAITRGLKKRKHVNHGGKESEMAVHETAKAL